MKHQQTAAVSEPGLLEVTLAASLRDKQMALPTGKRSQRDQGKAPRGSVTARGFAGAEFGDGTYWGKFAEILKTKRVRST